MGINELGSINIHHEVACFYVKGAFSWLTDPQCYSQSKKVEPIISLQTFQLKKLLSDDCFLPSARPGVGCKSSFLHMIELFDALQSLPY